MMKIYIKRIGDRKLNEIKEFENGCWVNLINPTVDEIKNIKMKMKIPSSFLTSPLDEDERPRIEKSRDKVLIIIRIPYARPIKDGLEVITIPLGVIILKNCIITVCKADNEIIKEFREEKIRPFYTTQKGRFLLYILRRTIYHYNKYLEMIEKKIRETESSIAKSLKNEEIMKLLMFQKTLVYFNGAIIANDKVFKRIIGGNVIKLHEKDKDLLEELILDNGEIMETVKMFNEIMSNTMDAYTSIVSNNLNIIMKVLTSLMIVFSVPLILPSFFGMNLSLPLQDDPNAFWMVVTASILTVIAMILLFKKMNWI